jgi:hypothetical protein
VSVKPWEPLLEDLTHVTPSLRAHYPEYWAPMTVGVEIEFKEYDLKACPAVKKAYNIYGEHLDTLETNLPPAIEYTPVLKAFVDTVLQCEGGKNFYWRKAGNHIHFRPREDIEAVKRDWLAAWKTAFDTIFTVSLLLLPALSFGEHFRERLYDVAPIYEHWIPPLPATIVMQWLKIEEERDSIRCATWLTPNADLTKPLTYELRANEGSPGQILLTVSVAQKAVKYAFERKFTPVLFTEATYFRFLEAVAEKREGEKLYWKDALRRVSPLEFRGLADMPYMKGSYRDGVEAFIDLVWLYTPRTTHHMRVAAPLALGVPISRKLHEKYWHLFAPEGSFCWELPDHRIQSLCDRNIRDMFSSREAFMDYVERYGEW